MVIDMYGLLILDSDQFCKTNFARLIFLSMVDFWVLYIVAT